MTKQHVFLALSLFLAGCGKESSDRKALLDTSHSSETAPETFRARFETSKGPFVIEAHRAWAPIGVDRFYYLVRHGFYDGTRFFRVLPNFMAQFGISGDPQIALSWQDRVLDDETAPPQSNLRGRVSFATRGPRSRTTQLFINYRNNTNLDGGYRPIGEVVEGMNAVDNLYSGYGEGAPNGNGPDQDRMTATGNAYLRSLFPKLDSIVTARIVGK
jgi:peptidyl-prolyl cis-trans isomerase A (cyclophilin A)